MHILLAHAIQVHTGLMLLSRTFKDIRENRKGIYMDKLHW